MLDQITRIDASQDIAHTSPSWHSHYFFTCEDASSLATIFEKPYQQFIELREYVHLPRVLEFIRNHHPAFSLSLTTHTAFKQPVADFFTLHLNSLFTFPANTSSDVKTCLQEAVMNAIIHGNLNITQNDRIMNNFQAYLETIEQHIEDDELGLKRVSLYAWHQGRTLTLCVADQGKGFELEQPEMDAAMPYGRGLALIRSMSERAWLTPSNHLYMQFECHANAE